MQRFECEARRVIARRKYTAERMHLKKMGVAAAAPNTFERVTMLSKIDVEYAIYHSSG